MWPKAIIQRKFPNFILQNLEKQIAPCEHNIREVSFEWSHDWIWSTDLELEPPYKTSSLTLAVKGLMSHISHFHPPTLAVALYAQFLMYVCFFFLSLFLLFPCFVKFVIQ